MDQSDSDTDAHNSPSQILKRLQMLRQLQILQRSKLQKQQLEYLNSPEITTSITELVSHFSDSTSYNTFRTLLQSPQEYAQSPDKSLSKRKDVSNAIEGITLLNLSQESEFINDSPSSNYVQSSSEQKCKSPSFENNVKAIKNLISLDEMPILSPKKDFEAILIEKLKNEESNDNNSNLTEISKCKSNKDSNGVKKPFLRRGVGMARFGINKNDLVIQNTKTLPWINKNYQNKQCRVNEKATESKKTTKNNIKVPTLVNEILENEQQKQSKYSIQSDPQLEIRQTIEETKSNTKEQICVSIENSCRQDHNNQFNSSTQNIFVKPKHPVLNSKGKTWAAVLSKEQNDLLAQLKQSDYYRNFLSPAKSSTCDVSCDENLSKIRQEKEVAEQNLFELLEKKVNHDSFHIDNSFFNRFLGRTTLESSGESTPLIFKKCISTNPKLMNIAPTVSNKEASHCDMDSCECTECSDICSSVSSCCSCKTQTELSQTGKEYVEQEIEQVEEKKVDSNTKKINQKECHNGTIVNNEVSTNMADMNAKLIATSELLKDRLRELEDEIETFRKENANLNKMREEIDNERQRFFEDKQEYEKKFNEDKILSDYYIAEEKEKLQKQKQLYERYVRDIRGRLNKKEKDEVVNLKKEIQDLKEDIRQKDAKSTSTIARLRNQIKIIEKEKNSLLQEVENLKKENRKIQHSNDITRRLTNIKYLEQINKKLSNMATNDAKSDIVLDPDIKYKSHLIERQSRTKNVQSHRPKNAMRPRAKSVPNLNVTSRYAKYFSQKDCFSDMEKCNVLNNYSDPLRTVESDNEIIEDFITRETNDSSNSYLSDEDNNLEIIYNERFKVKSPSPTISSMKNTHTNTSKRLSTEYESSNYFLNKKTINNSQKLSYNYANHDFKHQKENASLTNTSKSPTNVMNLSLTSDNSTHKELKEHYSYQTAGNRKINISPVASNNSSISQTSKVLNKESNNIRMTPSPEPSTSKISLMKTKLNPTEIMKPDGTKELRFPNGNVKIISADGKYSKFIYYNGDIKENFYNEARIKYFYSDTKTYHTTYSDGLEVLEFPDGQIEKRYKDGSSEIRLPNGSVRYFDPKNQYVNEEWRFPDGISLTVSADGEQRIVFPNGQVEIHTKDHKRREFPDGTMKLIYNDGTSETRYSSGRIRIKDKHGNLIMDSAPG